MGLILSLVGAYFVSSHYGRPDIFNNYLYSFIATVVGFTTFITAILAFALGSFIIPPQFKFRLEIPNPPSWLPFLALWLGVWGVVLASAYFLRKAYLGLAEAGGVRYFKMAANLLLIGSILFVVLIGMLIMLVAQVFAIIGAFNLSPPRRG